MHNPFVYAHFSKPCGQRRIGIIDAAAKHYIGNSAHSGTCLITVGSGYTLRVKHATYGSFIINIPSAAAATSALRINRNGYFTISAANIEIDIKVTSGSWLARTEKCN